MKLCVLTHLFPARSETFIYQHVIAMRKLGHEVSVIARAVGDGISEQELEDLDREGIERHYLRAVPNGIRQASHLIKAIARQPSCMKALCAPEPWSRSQLLLALDIADRVSEVDPDLLHIHFATLAARLERVNFFVSPNLPTVVTWHGYDANAIPRALGSQLYVPLFATNATHTVGSGFIQRRLLGLGASIEQVTVVPMGVDVEKFRVVSRRPINSDEPLSVLSVGRLDEVKGHRYLIDAIAMLLKRGVNVRLSIVGDGLLRNELQDQIKRLAVEEDVRLLGSLTSDQVVSEMSRADLFALACVETDSGKVESQGVVFAEAQAMELPVVACDVGGVSESLIDGKTGLLCAQRNALHLSEAIEFFAVDRGRLREFGVEGRRFAEERFSATAMAERFEKIYFDRMTV